MEAQAALGTTMGLSILSLFSIGPFLLVAAGLLTGAIVTAPNRTWQPSRWRLPYSLAYGAALGVVLGIAFV